MSAIATDPETGLLTDVPWRDTVLNRPLPVANGFYILDDTPGLGFDLLEAVENALRMYETVRKYGSYPINVGRS